MTDVLEFSDISAEIRGALCPGRLKLTDQNIIFKNNKTGKVEQISSGDLELSNWQKLVGSWGLRLFLKDGSLHRFCGFKDSELDKVAKYFKNNYSSEFLEKELSLKGWNWGTAKFHGSVLSFDINNLAAFEVPLSYVSQCTPGKNEVAVEFHQNDEAPVSLMEMRFHIPVSEIAGDDPVEAFHTRVMDKASVISNIGDAIAIFREIHCLTPRGRYDIKIFQSFFQLHGKTFDYKIPKDTIIRLFILPHKDGRQNFLVVSLDPPIKQGQTRYHFLVFLFGQDDDISIELPFTEEELKEKYEGKLTRELSGPTYDVIARIMKALVNRKITVPGNFRGHSGTPAVGCSYKAAAGYMYPLERGFIYIHKPPIHIRFEEISTVNFARSGGSTKSFDFEIELKSGVNHTFSSIEKEEYGKLFDFITSKKLRVKNKKSDKPDYSSIGDDFGDSDDEKAPDAYLARVKREGKERDEDGGEDSEDESDDEDFDPEAYEAKKKAEKSSGESSSSGEEEDSGSGAGVSDEEDAADKKKKKKPASERKPREKGDSKPRKKGKKKDKDENRPKRPPTAYFLWFNETREKIKSDLGSGASVTDIAKKAGELWKTVSDKSDYERRAGKLKEEYQVAMAEYKASGGGAKTSGGEEEKDKPKKAKSAPKKPAAAVVASPTKSGSGSNFKSKEFIEDSDSSSGDEKKSKPSKKSDSDDSEKESKSKEKKKPQAEKKKKKSDSEDEESEEEKKSKKKEDSDSEKEDKKKPKKKADSESEEEDKKKSKKKKADSESEEEEKKKPSKKKADSESEEILSSPTASSESEDEEDSD